MTGVPNHGRPKVAIIAENPGMGVGSGPLSHNGLVDNKFNQRIGVRQLKTGKLITRPLPANPLQRSMK